jgi:hypothetical protein
LSSFAEGGGPASALPLPVLPHTAHQKPSSRPKAAHLPPKWRDPRILPLPLPVLLYTPTKIVILSESGAFAAESKDLRLHLLLLVLLFVIP